jgi:regulator of RNase E activity RraB
MHFLLPFLLLLETAGMPPIDPARVDAELAADEEVLQSLRENGDVPNIARHVDVRFVGPLEAVALLEKRIGALGWRVVQRVSLEDGTEALDVQRLQTTDAAAIRELTEAALRIEGEFGVQYDGWGTVATSS